MALLELKNISYYDNDHQLQILYDISLSVNEGQMIGIAGESGGGKTTLGLILAGILIRSSGEILLNGIPANNLMKNREIQILMQNKGELINPYRKVKAVLKEAFELKGKRSDSESAIKSILEKLELKEDILNRKGYELSGGEQQRIAFARLLAVKPRILILDEPFSAQDIEAEMIIMELLKELNEESGLTIICISHDLRLLRYFTEQILIISKGRIVERGPTSTVLTNPEHEYTKFLLRAENYDLNIEDILKSE
jgi:peptide/nickel transport system ATP-binding protein